MKHVINHEFKRLYKSFLVILVLSFLVLFLNDMLVKNIKDTLMLEYKVITFVTILTSLYFTIVFVRDSLSYRRLLYLNSDVSKEKIIIGKLIIIVIFTTIILLLMMIHLNIRAKQFYTNNFIEYIRINFDDYGLILFNRSILEWFYPLNLLLNLTYLSLTILSILAIYKFLQIKKREKSVDIFISCFLIVTGNVIVKLIVNFINNKVRILNFNYILPRVRAMALMDYELNFLSLFSIIVYAIISIAIIKLSNFKVGGKR